MKHRAINMVAQPPIRESEAANWDFFLKIPDTDRKLVSMSQVKDVQLLQPLFEFSGACSGCGETPYVKLHDPALRRPYVDRQRHRLLLHLRRQPAHHALLSERGGPRPRLVQLAV